MNEKTESGILAPGIDAGRLQLVNTRSKGGCICFPVKLSRCVVVKLPLHVLGAFELGQDQADPCHSSGDNELHCGCAWHNLQRYPIGMVPVRPKPERVEDVVVLMVVEAVDPCNAEEECSCVSKAD